MTHEEFHKLTDNMMQGGAFVSSLARAMRYADPTNRNRLLNAFPDVIERYGPNGMFAVARSMAESLVENKQ